MIPVHRFLFLGTTVRDETGPGYYQLTPPLPATPSTSSRGRALVALDVKSGKLRWSVTTGPDAAWPWGHESGDFYISSPVLAGDLVLFGGGDGLLYAIDAARGTVRWKA